MDNPMASLSDDDIRRLAKARAGFKVHVLVYAVVNLFLAVVWFVTSGMPAAPTLEGGSTYYWPIWPHLGWGLGLAIHGFGTYYGGTDFVRREEERLREKYGRSR